MQDDFVTPPWKIGKIDRIYCKAQQSDSTTSRIFFLQKLFTFQTQRTPFIRRQVKTRSKVFKNFKVNLYKANNFFWNRICGKHMHNEWLKNDCDGIVCLKLTPLKIKYDGKYWKYIFFLPFLPSQETGYASTF